MSDLAEMATSGGITPPEKANPGGAEATVPVWDPLVRLFHWSLVVAFVAAWATGDELQALHEVTGYTIVGLLVIRLIWGVIGTRHARFSDFVYRPSTVIRHLKDTLRFRAKRYMGHNPAGGAMVIGLMVMLAITAATGIALTGEESHFLEEAHEAAANLTLVLVGLHIAGVFVSSVEHRENLVRAMITGRKRPEDRSS